MSLTNMGRCQVGGHKQAAKRVDGGIASQISDESLKRGATLLERGLQAKASEKASEKIKASEKDSGRGRLQAVPPGVSHLSLSSVLRPRHI